MDGTDWISVSYVPAPHFYMADLGHDVYIGNGRGTEYSQGHAEYDASTDQAQYWDFTYDDMSADVLAMSKVMHEDSNSGKGWYFGYSEGTMTMQVALLKYEQELSNYIHRAILLAPCTAEYKDGDNPDDAKPWLDEVGLLRSIGVHALYGPTWEDDVQKICDNLQGLDPTS